MSPNLTQLLKQQSAPEDDSWQPVFFRLSEEADAAALEKLLSDNPNILVRDQILLQLKDLVKLEHPKKVLTDEEYRELIDVKLTGKAPELYGVWVYYPWKREIVHLLDEEEFIRVRTIRNAYKITFEEQAILRRKKVGVIGLSVGQSVSISLIMERIIGEIWIADFDHIELSNLNRLRTSNSNLGQNKAHIVAREIAEIDPFIKVIIYRDGVNRDNVGSFLDNGTSLDCLVEECDSIEVKLLVRRFCRQLRIPVVSETSDLMLLDVERFDLEPDYEIYHSLIRGYDDLDFLSSEDKMIVLLKILELDKVSARGRYSFSELRKSITTWPQLASDVLAGGAITSILIREILLGASILSGRARLNIVEHYSNELDQFRKSLQTAK